MHRLLRLPALASLASPALRARRRGAPPTTTLVTPPKDLDAFIKAVEAKGGKVVKGAASKVGEPAGGKKQSAPPATRLSAKPDAEAVVSKGICLGAGDVPWAWVATLPFCV